MMRVKTGRNKGQRLQYPKQGLRPTKDIVKQAIVNILRERLLAAEVADLYCGAGALGIELLSHGARGAVFVEKDRRTARLLKENVSRYGDRAEVLVGDVLKLMPKLARRKLDIVVADPPYEQGLDQTTLEAIQRAGILNRDGIVILEHSRRDHPVPPPGLEPVKRHNFGDTVLAVYRSVEP